MILVLMTNLLVGLGLSILGVVMLRRSERAWVGVRIPHNEDEIARVRRANHFTAPWLLLLGTTETLSVLAGALYVVSPLTLAVTGLAILLISIGVIGVAAVISR